MKKVLLFAVIAAMVAVSCQKKQANFSLTGKMEGEIDEAVIVSIYGQDGVEILDTLTFTDGVVNYSTHLEEPVLVIVGVNKSRNSINFFGENTAYTINGNVNGIADAKVTGGDLFTSYKDISDIQAAFHKQYDLLRQEYRAAQSAKDTVRQNEIIKEVEESNKNVEEQQKAFIEANSASPIAAFLVRNLYGHESLEKIKEGMGKLDASLKTSPYYQALQQRVEKLETVAVGKEAPDFTMMDVDGNPLSLSSYRGKYVLIDFWASWCGPCRRENPHVVELYNEYKDKGFDILGVSLDNKKENWLKAIEDDQLVWNQVSDLQGWKNEVAQLYAVSSIPHTVLLDKEGKIIAKNLRGDELRAKVAELLN